MLTGKTVLLGVTGGIAAYKTASLASMLKRAGADVHVIMTENAKNFITPVTFENLTGNRCLTDTFDRSHPWQVEHVALGKKADLMMIAPASANVIGKMAAGLADDMLTTQVLACRAPIYLAPAMNTTMYHKPVVQRNLKILEDLGMHVIQPASGRLACGDMGLGKMPEAEELMDEILLAIACRKDLAGKKVLVTAGPTQEAIDPVRFLSNHSSGKMGYALARAAALRGAAVTLVSGKTELKAPAGVELVAVVSAEEMYDAVTSRGEEMDIVIKAAAVADYRPRNVSDEKIKKKDGGDWSIPLERTRDILKYLGEHKKEGQFLCGFSMETEHMLENSRAKLVKKNLDMIVANNLKEEGAGFQGSTNLVTLISREKEIALGLMSKDEVAHKILDAICNYQKKS